MRIVPDVRSVGMRALIARGVVGAVLSLVACQGNGAAVPSGAGGSTSLAGTGGGIPTVVGAAGTVGNSAGTTGSAAGAAGNATGSGGTAVGAAGGPGGRGGATVGTGGTSGAQGGQGGTAPAPIGAVTFSVPSQAFQGQLMVGMTMAAAGAEIRYTTDRTVPSASSRLYSGQPLAVSTTTEIRAQGYIGGLPAGPVGVAIYILRDFDATSDIPLMIVDDFGLGQPLDRNVFIDAAVMIFEPRNGVAKLSDLPTMVSHAGWHVRGQSSAGFPQKPYRVELRDGANQDVDQAVLGMPAESDWALIPPYRDRALIRNPLVYDLGREMGLTAPRLRFAEVYINLAARALRSGDYAGVYWVTETIKNAKNRLNLSRLKETDTTLPALSGGYIVKFDWLVSEPPTLTCAGSPPSLSAPGAHCWTDLEVVDPDPLGPEQQTWITDYIQRLHNSLQTTPLGDHTSMIDAPSVVDMFVINELTRNLDAYTRSAFYHKDRDGKLKAGPVWDYNYAIDCGRATNRNPEGWQYLTEPQTTRMGGSNWIPRLATDPAFMAQVKARWKQLRGGILATAAIDARISAMVAPLAAAAERDNTRWPVRSVLQGDLGPTVATWTGQVQAVRDWLAKRVIWLDAQLP